MSMRRPWNAALGALLLWGAGIALCAGACSPPGQPRLEGMWLAEADGLLPRESGPIVMLRADAALPAASEQAAGPVQVVADRDLGAGVVAEWVSVAAAHGALPQLLAWRRDGLGRLPPADPKVDESLLLRVTPGEVRACLSPPGVEEAACVSRLDRKHVDRAYVRQLVRTARKKYGIHSVHVWLPPELGWGDAVRAIDGARTCCGPDAPRVSWEIRSGAWPRGFKDKGPPPASKE